MSGFRLPAPGASSGAPPALAHHLAQAYRIVEQGLNSSVQNGQDYEVGAGKIWVTSPDGTRYYITVADDGTLTTNGNPTPPAGTVTSVAATAPAAGFSIAGSPITSSGTLVFTLANDLAALEGLSSTGFGVRTAADTWAQRTLQSGAAMQVTNGSGVSGDPSIAFAAKDYIGGLIMTWNSATSLTVTTGAAYIEGLGRVLEASSAITKSSLSLSANTWYHLYLYDNSGTPDIEISTTNPVLYSGTAASKTGDNTRRYVGSVRTDGSGNILQFLHDNNAITYLYDVVGTGRKLSGGSATTATAVDLSSVVPGTSRSAQITVTNGATTAALVTRSPDQPSSGGAVGPFTFLTMSGGNETSTTYHPVSSSQQIEYLFLAAPGGSGAFIDVLGYRYTR